MNNLSDVMNCQLMTKWGKFRKAFLFSSPLCPSVFRGKTFLSSSCEATLTGRSYDLLLNIWKDFLHIPSLTFPGEERGHTLITLPQDAPWNGLCHVESYLPVSDTCDAHMATCYINIQSLCSSWYVRCPLKYTCKCLVNLVILGGGRRWELFRSLEASP